MYYLVLLTIVGIGQYVQDERIKELKKRREVQKDIYNIVQNTFSILLAQSGDLSNEAHCNLVLKIANLFSTLYGLDEEKIKYLEEYHLELLRFDVVKSQFGSINDLSYEELMNVSSIGKRVVERIQLAQKASDITRAICYGTVNEKFINQMKEIQPDTVSQIILLSDVYVSFRNALSYKRPYSHSSTSEVILKYGLDFFDSQIITRFQQFNQQLDELYEKI
jgi:hypothetical protein